MKASTLLIFSIIITLFTACYTETIIGPEGPRGAQGPVGPQGADGENGYVFEWENVNFTAPNYEAVLEFPKGFDGLSSDVALAYLLWDTYETNNGEVVEVWRSLSQTILLDYGTLIYNYDFGKYDVRLFLDADFSKDLLGAIDTDGWIVRVVVVPGAIWNAGRVNFTDYNSVKKALGLNEPDKIRDTIQRR